MAGTVFSDDFVLNASQSSTGSKMPHADWNILKIYPVVIPPKEIVLNYQLFNSGIINKIENSVIQNQQLSELRNWLLHMLMNGQVTVGDCTHSPCPISQIQNRSGNKNGSGVAWGN